MPSTYTTRNRAEKQAPGENNNSWGALLNGGAIDIFDQALDGMIAFSLSGAKLLTTSNGASDEARCRFVKITGGTGGTVTIPNVEKTYLVRNGSSGNTTFTTGSGTTATVVPGLIGWIVCTGTNVVYQAVHSVASVVGTLPVTNGGTGVTTSTGTGSVVLSASPTLTGTINGAGMSLSNGLTVTAGGASVALAGNGVLTLDSTTSNVDLLMLKQGGTLKSAVGMNGLEFFVKDASNNVRFAASTGATPTVSLNNTQVLTTRQTGWTAATNTKSRSTFDTTTVTTSQLAQRVAALIDDLITHGVIGV